MKMSFIKNVSVSGAEGGKGKKREGGVHHLLGNGSISQMEFLNETKGCLRYTSTILTFFVVDTFLWFARRYQISYFDKWAIFY